jgi:hypothetical protein
VKTPSITGNRILLENGLPVARFIADDVEEFPGISEQASYEARQRLMVIKQWPGPSQFNKQSGSV